VDGHPRRGHDGRSRRARRGGVRVAHRGALDLLRLSPCGFRSVQRARPRAERGALLQPAVPGRSHPRSGVGRVNDPYWKHAFSLTNPELPWGPDFGCGLGWSIKGSDSDDEDATIPPSADWDYWVGSVLSGISFLPPWGGTATWAARGTDDTQKGLLGAFAIYPEYVNWAPWGSSVQTLATCVPATARAALRGGAGNGRLRAA
jgi:hypothetical protein